MSTLQQSNDIKPMIPLPSWQLSALPHGRQVHARQWCMRHLEYGPGWTRKVWGFVRWSVCFGWGLMMQLLLSWNSLDRLSCPQAPRTTQALPSKAGIKVLHHTQLRLQFLITGAPTGAHLVGSYSLVIHRQASKGPIYHWGLHIEGFDASMGNSLMGY